MIRLSQSFRLPSIRLTHSDLTLYTIAKTILSLAVLGLFVNVLRAQSRAGLLENPEPLVSISADNMFDSSHALYTGIIKLIPIINSQPMEPRFIPVIGGMLRCSLRPNDANSFYIASFLEHDRVVAYEKWVVPDVSYPLLVDNVRRIGPVPESDTIIPHDTGTISESSVIGLLADLAVRPVKGPNFAASAVVISDQNGLLETASGAPTDCIRADGWSGPCDAVTTVFGRVGDISPQATDYQGIYQPFDPTLVRFPSALPAGALPVSDGSGNLLPSGCTAVSGTLSCSNGSQSSLLSLPELSTNGENTFMIYGKDIQAASACIIMPDSSPAPGQVLAASSQTATTTDGTTCPVMTWVSLGTSPVVVSKPVVPPHPPVRHIDSGAVSKPVTPPHPPVRRINGGATSAPAIR